MRLCGSILSIKMLQTKTAKTNLQERRCLGRRHPRDHGLQELWQHRQQGIARVAHQIDDEIPDIQAPGLVVRSGLVRQGIGSVVIRWKRDLTSVFVRVEQWNDALDLVGAVRGRVRVARTPDGG